MSDEELIELGEMAAAALGKNALEKLEAVSELLDEYTIEEIRNRLEKLEKLEERLENLEESVDLDQLRDIMKRLRSAFSSAEKLEESLAAVIDDLVVWTTDLHAVINKQ